MRQSIYHILLPLCFALLSACSTTPEPQGFTPQIVVDGYITQGEKAVIHLSQLYPMVGDKQEDMELSDIPIRWAKVTVTCDGVSEVCMGRPDSLHLLGYKYETLKMRGETNKRYDLKVEYAQRTVTASTTIPAPPTASPLRFQEVEQQGERYNLLSITLQDQAVEQENYYLISAQTDPSTHFQLTTMGVWCDKELKAQQGEVSIYRPIKLTDMSDDKDSFYSLFYPREGDWVVQVSQIDSAAYAFWHMQQEQLFSTSNLVYPTVENIPTNVTGGLGIWYGKGSLYYPNIAKESLRNCLSFSDYIF